MDLGTMIMMTVLVMIMVWIEIVKSDNTWVSLYWQPGRAGSRDVCLRCRPEILGVRTFTTLIGLIGGDDDDSDYDAEVAMVMMMTMMITLLTLNMMMMIP